MYWLCIHKVYIHLSSHFCSFIDTDDSQSVKETKVSDRRLREDSPLPSQTDLLTPSDEGSSLADHLPSESPHHIVKDELPPNEPVLNSSDSVIPSVDTATSKLDGPTSPFGEGPSSTHSDFQTASMFTFTNTPSGMEPKPVNPVSTHHAYNTQIFQGYGPQMQSVYQPSTASSVRYQPYPTTASWNMGMSHTSLQGEVAIQICLKLSDYIITSWYDVNYSIHFYQCYVL